MMSVSSRLAIGLVCAAAATSAEQTTVAGQSAPATDAPRVELSRDTIELGDAFELRVRFVVADGRLAYFPDTLPSGAAVESLESVEWRVESGADGVRELTLTYPLIGLRTGAVTLPDVTVLSGPARTGDGEVGAWSDVRTDPGLAGTLTAHTAPGPSLWIASVLESEGADEVITPRPPDDVIGPSWSRGIVLAGLACGAVLAWIVFASGRDRLLARRGARAPRPMVDRLEEARRAALAALDELRRLGLVEAGRVDELYGRSSGAVRSYIEQLDPAWGPAHTSTELMRDLERRANGDGSPELHREMRIAEVVKFGRLRPGAPEADRHLSILRAWVAGTPPGVEP